MHTLLQLACIHCFRQIALLLVLKVLPCRRPALGHLCGCGCARQAGASLVLAHPAAHVVRTRRWHACACRGA